MPQEGIRKEPIVPHGLELGNERSAIFHRVLPFDLVFGPPRSGAGGG